MASAKVRVGIKGGQKLDAALTRILQKLGADKGVVSVGFLENAKYSGQIINNKAGKPVKRQAGLSIAQAAFWNEFGTKRAPPRPFFRGMIADKSPAWGGQMAKILKATQYDKKRTLGLMGELIQGQLRKSIQDFTSPPLAAYTIEQKGFDKPLIDTQGMQDNVDYKVTT